jgi:hypothetical protein
MPSNFPTEHFVARLANADVEKCSITVLAGQANLDQTCFHLRSLTAESYFVDRRSDQFRDESMAPEIDAIVGPGMRCSKTEQGHLIR